MSLPATKIRPSVGDFLLVEEADDRGLPGARRPDEEDELALLDVRSGLVERRDVALVDLGDVLESDHLTYASSRSGTCKRGAANPVSASEPTSR